LDVNVRRTLMHKKLFIPGPTEVRKEVLEAQTKPMIGHRMKEFSELYHNVITKTTKALETKNTVLVGTISGSGFMEAGVRNFVGTMCLNTTCGAFSERWHKITKQNGKPCEALSVDWGMAVKPEAIDKELSTGKYDAITVVHNETSTGVMNPVKEIGEVMKKYPDVIFMVDAVSSMAGAKIDFDAWGIDLCVASTQKAFALPAGLAVAVISDKALAKAEKVEHRGSYSDFLAMKKRYDEKHQTPNTPAVSLLFAMDVQLDRMLAEGMDKRYARHAEMAQIVRKWATDKGFELFAEPGYESLTLTTVKNNKGISVADLNKELGTRGFAISNGYGKLKEETFRIAHMGDLTPDEVRELLQNIDEILGG
jgi:predicted phosphoserine aminotransferase